MDCKLLRYLNALHALTCMGSNVSLFKSLNGVNGDNLTRLVTNCPKLVPVKESQRRCMMLSIRYWPNLVKEGP